MLFFQLYDTKHKVCVEYSSSMRLTRILVVITLNVHNALVYT